MTADPAFRLSTYLALALACAALGAAEFPLLPEVGWFAAAVIVALAVVYRLESRVEFLSIPAANNLGIGITLAGAGWAAVRVVREVRAAEFAYLGWVVFVVLLMAPVLMAAVVALLLRREKNAEVYWYLHAAALAAVVLASAIARRPWEVALLAGYAAVAVWNLTRFALARGGAAPSGHPRAGVVSAAGLFALAAAAAAPVFALTPASPYEKWDFGPGRIEIGFTPDSSVDLNRTGELAADDEVAFEVTAEDATGPKDDLAPNTRWRGRLLSHYTNGGWRRDASFKLPQVLDMPARVEPWVPPQFGPGAYRLRFTVPATLRSPILTEPLVWVPRQPVPVADVFAPPTPPRGWFPLADGTLLHSPTRPDRSLQMVYVQHTAPLPDQDLGVGFHAGDRGDQVLTNNPVPAVKAYASRLLTRLVREGKLPPAAGAVDAIRLRPPEAQHEAVARAFSLHLAESPEFSYTLSLTRTRPDLDPVEEFLEHAKTGHCERYASALVLMLRSQGIPAALVIGFKGQESVGDGRYLVRQDRTHAWATALVTRPGEGGIPLSYWLSLDPTPAVGDTSAGQEAAANSGWSWVWDKFLDATPEERLEAVGELARNPAAVGSLVGIVALGIFSWVGWRFFRVRVAAPLDNDLLDPLLTLLARHGFTSATGETPREFAARVTAALAARPGTAEVASVPPAWVDGYYEERFGGAVLAAERRATLDAGLTALRTALSATHPGGTR